MAKYTNLPDHPITLKKGDLLLYGDGSVVEFIELDHTKTHMQWSEDRGFYIGCVFEGRLIKAGDNFYSYDLNRRIDSFSLWYRSIKDGTVKLINTKLGKLIYG